MRKLSIYLVLAAVCLSMTSCFTLIQSVASSHPAPQKPTVVTTVTKPSTPPQQTTIVITETYDYYRQLDLRAVGAAFAQARNVREFEQLLNSSRYMVTNLDLNRDGWVDYLRVMETRSGYTHVLLIQAVLGYNMLQNVATVVVDMYPGRRYVQIIGDPFIYGNNYYVDPVFTAAPPIYNYMGGNSYTCWSSPYTWGAFPSYYCQPKPVYQTHYEAYVVAYLSGHACCHDAHYTNKVHTPEYVQISQPSRQDFATANPTRAFRNNNTETNAATLIASPRQPSTTSTSSTTTSGGVSSASGSSVSRPATTTTKPATPTTQKTQTTQTTSTTTRQPAANTTTISTRVQNNGKTTTTVRSVDEAGKKTTTSRTATTGRQSSATSTSTTPTRGTSTTSTRTTSTTSTTSTGTAPTRR